jgi:hypothetical protein
MLRRILPLATLLLLATCAETPARQAPAKPDAQKSEKADAAQKREGAKRYAELLGRLRRGDRSVDFTELRMAYTETEQYDPYGDSAARKAMFAAMNAGDWDEARKQSAKILEKNYVDINGHLGAFVAAEREGDKQTALLHRYVFEGLIKSVQGGGDGRSMETAFVVISVDEEYALLNFLGLRRTRQGLLNGGGHSYDKLYAVDPGTNAKHEFYFQIDKPLGSLARGMK